MMKSGAPVGVLLFAFLGDIAKACEPVYPRSSTARRLRCRGRLPSGNALRGVPCRGAIRTLDGTPQREFYSGHLRVRIVQEHLACRTGSEHYSQNWNVEWTFPGDRGDCRATLENASDFSIDASCGIIDPRSLSPVHQVGMFQTGMMATAREMYVLAHRQVASLQTSRIAAASASRQAAGRKSEAWPWPCIF